jgi:hypothetical protein
MLVPPAPVMARPLMSRVHTRGEDIRTDAALFAGGWAAVSGVKAEPCGRDIIRKVTHRLDTALRTRAQQERAADPASS